MILKKLTAAVSALAMSASVLAYVPTGTEGNVAAADSKYNYAEALQKSMFFYEVQQAGKLPDWNYVTWRADSMVNEDGEETDVCKGGWFDAGDHFKFTLTNAYSASVLAWGYLEYKDAVDKQGLGEVRAALPTITSGAAQRYTSASIISTAATGIVLMTR